MEVRHRIIRLAKYGGIKVDQEKFFCPNCGNEITEKDDFCGNCGYALAEFFKNSSSNLSSNNGEQKQVTPQYRAIHKKPISRRKKIFGSIIAVIVIILIGGYYIGKNYYSPEKQLERAMVALSDSDAGSALNYLTTDDPKLNLTKKNIKPLLAYLNSHHEVLNGLRSGTNTSLFRFEKSGNHLLVFPAYKFKINGIYPNLSTNISGTKVTVSGKKVGTLTKGNNKEVGPYVPGQYKFVATANISGKKITTNTVRDFISDSSSTDIDFDFQTIDLTAVGYPGAVVNIDDTKVGILDQYGRLSIKNYPVTDNSKLTEVYDTGNNKTLTSRKVAISGQDGGEISVGYPGVISHYDADSLISSVYSNASYLTMGSDSDTEEDLADLFTDGSSNKYYQDLLKMVEGYHNDDTISSVSITPDFKHVYPLAKDQAKIIYNVKYEFDHENGTHTQVFQYVGQINKVADSDYRLASFELGKKISDESDDF